MIRLRRFVQFNAVVMMSLGLLSLFMLFVHGQESPAVQAIQVAKVNTTETTANVPACQPYTDSVNPTQLPLATAQTGLTQVIEQPATYQIYGVSNSDLEQQIAACAPTSGETNKAEFTAETSYRLSWQYDFQNRDDGTCSLSNIRLGLHIGMVLPEWSTSTQAQTGLSAQWQTFMTNLRTHENGHVALDVQYSQQLLTTLQALPATSCDTITGEATDVITQAVDTLNQANDEYDTVTNHGATQGAIIP